jgi:hypothetical protein
MTLQRLTLRLLVLGMFTLAFTSFAQAQATRTWVSGVGDDVNPCSRTAPCKTYAGAISKTAKDGEISTLDPGGFGTLTITKSITVNGGGTGQGYGSVLSALAPQGFLINITDVNDIRKAVRLNWLDINGASTGTNGIRFIAGKKLTVENTNIDGLTTDGIIFNAAGGDLVVRNVSVRNVGGSGIRTLSTLSGSAGVIHVTIDNVHSTLNGQGIRFEGNTFGVVKNSVASNNTLNGFVVNPISVGGAEMEVMDSTANNNRQFGIFAGGTGQTGVVRIFNTTVFHSATSQLEVAAGGQIQSNGRNHIGTPTDAPSVFTDQ